MSKWSSAYRDSRWQEMRLRIMERDEFECKSCRKKGDNANLCVHHAFYESGKAPWEYEEHSLVTLCEECHERFHHFSKSLSIRIVSDMICGMHGNQLFDEILGYVDASGGPPVSGESQDYLAGYARASITINKFLLSKFITKT